MHLVVLSLLVTTGLSTASDRQDFFSPTVSCGSVQGGNGEESQEQEMGRELTPVLCYHWQPHCAGSVLKQAHSMLENNLFQLNWKAILQQEQSCMFSFSTGISEIWKINVLILWTLTKSWNSAQLLPLKSLGKLLDRMPKNLVDISFSSCDGVCKSLSRLIYVSSYVMKLC